MTENTLRDRLRDLARVGQPDALADRALARAKRMRRRHIALAAGGALALVAISVPALLALRPGPGPNPLTVAGGTGDPGGPGVVQGGDVWTSCDAVAPDHSMIGTDAVGLARLADDFVPVAAVVCDEQHVQHADGSEELVAFERRAEEIAALVAALRLPDEPMTGNPCTMELRGVRWFVLLDADGRWVRPGLPVESCGKIRMEVVDAAAALQTTDVSSRVVRVLVTAEQAATGCAPGWSDLVAMQTQTSGSQPVTTAPALDDGEVRLCVYAVPTSEHGSDKPVGTVVAGGVLDADRVAAIAAALPGLPLAQECTEPAGSFAILFTSGNHDAVYAELDGCQRVLMYTPDGRAWLGQADEAFLALLDS
jgi:hypothetical protein